MSNVGLNKNTGRKISDIDHLQQSITDILTTPLKTLVMRRDYGSLLPRLIDAAGNEMTKIKMMAATVDALTKWEPRLHLTHVQLLIMLDGKIDLIIEGIYNEQVLRLNTELVL